MPLNELEQQRVEKIIGEFCRKRVPLHLQNQIRLLYKIRGNDVVIYESRPHWQEKDTWTETPIARCTYDPKTKTWMLYWQRANGIWMKHPDVKPAKDLKSLVPIIDNDPLQVFWG